MCPRKAFCHISHNDCLQIYNETLCGKCQKKFHILQEQQEEMMLEKKKKAERRELKTPRGPKGEK